VPLSSLQRGCAPIPASDRGYLIYCSTGKRCREAASLLRTGSDADIRIVRGGYDALCTVPSAGSAAPRRQPV
jgi:rhodanese-related sulfurtransferase